jgi:phage replication O-like protein O
MEERPAQTFRGFRSPNTTPIPDELFDELLADLSGAELKVLLYICRRTFGWKKESDTISIKQMTEGIKKKDGTWLDRGTGLVKDSIARAVKSLEQRGVILRVRKRSEAKGDEPTTYTLNVLPVSENRTGGGPKIGQGGVRKSDTQETGLQETVNNTVPVNGDETIEEKSKPSTGDESIFVRLPDLDQPPEHTAYMAQELLNTLGDQHSERFYALVARKIPEANIRQALSEIKADGADSPAKLFTFKMKKYALQH